MIIEKLILIIYSSLRDVKDAGKGKIFGWKIYRGCDKIAATCNQFLDLGQMLAALVIIRGESPFLRRRVKKLFKRGSCMKENKYDQELFFQKYSEMLRSRKGLAGAGEWAELKKLLPDFSGRRVLDLGCGYGWHCKYAREQGAASVLGTDLSWKMLDQARKRNAGDGITYRQAAMEDLDFPAGSFDVALSSLAFHYVRDFAPLVQNIHRWLSEGGAFVFSVEHPVFTAQGSQDWYYGENGEILHFPVDNYYLEGVRDAVFLGERVIKYHRTLTTYLDTLLQSGFTLRSVVEPPPPENMMDLPGMKDELRRPMMLLVAAQKLP